MRASVGSTTALAGIASRPPPLWGPVALGRLGDSPGGCSCCGPSTPPRPLRGQRMRTCDVHGWMRRRDRALVFGRQAGQGRATAAAEGSAQLGRDVNNANVSSVWCTVRGTAESADGPQSTRARTHGLPPLPRCSKASKCRANSRKAVADGHGDAVGSKVHGPVRARRRRSRRWAAAAAAAAAVQRRARAGQGTA